MAAFLFGGLAVGLARDGWALPSSPFEIALSVLAVSLGICALFAAYLASSDRVEKLADAFSRHEISIILLVLAWPIQLVLESMWMRKQKDEQVAGGASESETTSPGTPQQ